MCGCRTPQPITNTSSVRKKFPTLACRPSTSLTRRTTQCLGSAKKSLGVAGAAAVAADSTAAGAVGEAAGAVAAAVAVAGVAAGDRRDCGASTRCTTVAAGAIEGAVGVSPLESNFLGTPARE